MSERTNGQRNSNDGGDPASRGAFDGVHPGEEQLNALLDGALSTIDRANIERHVEACAGCRRQLAELRAVSAMLRALPAPRPRRSFQLGPQHERRAASFGTRVGAWLLPALPALRASTVAVALLLAAVSIRNVADDASDRGVVSDIPATHVAQQAVEPTQEAPGQTVAAPTRAQMPAQPTDAAPAELDEAGPAESDDGGEAGFAATEQPFAAAEPPSAGDTVAESAAEPALAPAMESDAADQEIDQPDARSAGEQETGDQELESAAAIGSGAGEAEEGAVTSGDEDIAMAAAVPGSPTLTLDPTSTVAPASPTATLMPSPTATAIPPTPSATATPAPAAITAATRADGLDGWRWVQFGLAIGLILLIGLVVGLQRLRSRLRSPSW